MKKYSLKAFLFVIICFPFHPKAQESFRLKDRQVEDRLENLVSLLTLDEKIDMLAGYKDFYFHPVERLGIPAFVMADGPLGIASWGIHGRATAFPAGICAAATWNKTLMATMGDAFGQEWRARGIHYMLGPGVNMYRASKCGRNFEYFGEDPYLTSELVVPFIQKVQARGIAATIKHFVGNEQEFNRYQIGSDIDERTLHEIYLTPFKAAVQKAKVWALMAAYNPLNGVWNTQNAYTLDTILKKKWGFQGLVMSDWDCTYSTDTAANAGLDMEMGSYQFFTTEKVKEALASGSLTQQRLTDMVKRIFRPAFALGFFDRPQKDASIPLYNTSAIKIARQVAEEGIVLLKNKNNLLPLNKDISSIAVFGKNANPLLYRDRVSKAGAIVYGGGGSSVVNPWYNVDLLTGIRNNLSSQTKLNYIDSASGESVAEIALNSSVAIVCVGFNGALEKEGEDRPFQMPKYQEELLRTVTAANPNTIVIVNAGGGVDMSAWVDKVPVIIHSFYAGMEGGNALSDILFGKINPSGKLPFSIERTWEQSPAFGNYDEHKDTANSISYKEGIFMGYRFFEHKKIKPLFSFGSGLSYTTFKYSNPIVRMIQSGNNPKVQVSFTITNTGLRDGYEIAQLYVKEVRPSVERPEKELKGFEKIWLKKGQQKTVTFILEREAFSFYDVSIHDWKWNKGNFELLMASAADKVLLSKNIELK